MIIFENVIVIILYLAVISLDIMIFFTSIRLMVRRWPNKWLCALDHVGAPLVKLCLEYLTRVAHRLGAHRLNEKTKVSISLCVLIIVRLLLGGTLQWVIIS
jgi:hypothetical protein